MRPPFGGYVHAVEATAAQRLLFVSGQLGIATDGTVPDTVEAQTELVLANIEACLIAQLACASCTDACLGEKHIDRLRRCVRATLDCSESESL